VFTVDEFGTWLYSPEGTLVQGEKDGVIAFNEVGRGNRDEGAHCIHLAPPAGWWFAVWADDGNVRSVTVDVCVPPSLTARNGGSPTSNSTCTSQAGGILASSTRTSSRTLSGKG
jgi:hypothetical protein